MLSRVNMVLTRPQEPEGAQQEGLKKQQQQQPAELGGLEATANKTGFDFSRPTYGCDKWISSFDGQLPLIDLGCGLGSNTCAALSAGAAVVAVDPSEQHLETTRERAPVEAVKGGRLRTVVGELAMRVDGEPVGPVVGDGGASGVLCAQVLHFLRPSQVREAFHELERYLKPGGTLVLTCASIYQLPTELMEQAEAQLQSQGPDCYPGWVVDTDQALGPGWHDKGEEVERAMHKAMPRSFHAFHPVQLRHHAEAVGLEVEECSLISGEKVGLPPALVNPPDSPHAGQDIVVLVARKKKNIPS